MTRKHIPNIITVVRFIGTIGLACCELLSPMFYLLYFLCGISDVLDGWLARKMKVESEAGARLDSVADVFFYAVVLVRMLPILVGRLPVSIWYGVGVIMIIRLCSYGVAFLKYHCFASLHTYMNKLTGLAVFFIPYVTWKPAYFVQFCIVTCAIAAVASLEELLIHMIAGEYNADRKTVFIKSKIGD